ncbi:hypothetical protein KR018_012178 [Drosophila ironensis]|nr:hypothetical protein KR018_012178 [Drosophila ironensis]
MAPFKRMRQPKITTQALLDFDLGESSSDSDFLPDIDNCSEKDESDEGASSDASSDSDSDSGEDSDAASEDSTLQLRQLLADTAADQDEPKPVENGIGGIGGALNGTLNGPNRVPAPPVLSSAPAKRMCCVCLGERSDDVNEIVECDACGVSVHEGCYGVSDNVSISSTNSTCSTEPWFCEACRAGVSEPDCELCPNKGGIYKETDVGKWVHLICALYVPGVAFGEVEQLSSVTLFEMQYSKWGAKVCSLCENSLFARTGVCIGCDAGMCKTYFHVTCAQVAGFLIEAHHEDDAADPFYAHCKVHSEKEMIKKRRRNYHTLRLNLLQRAKEKELAASNAPSGEEPPQNPAQARIQRKLQKIQQKYTQHKEHKPTPWVPTQKMSRLLTTSASACRRLLAKAEIMSVDVQHLEQREANINALTDIRKKWHITPAFSVEFAAYYMDRIVRMEDFRQQQRQLIGHNAILSKDQDVLRVQYDNALEERKAVKSAKDSLLASVKALHSNLAQIAPNLTLPSVEAIAHPPKPSAPTPPQRPISVPTAAALKMGVGFPLAHLGPPGSKPDSSRMLSTQAKQPKQATSAAVEASTACGICKRSNDQHLLVKCDTCKLHYHLGCLNPPLTRPPKKSKQYGWQCSKCCDKSEGSDAAPEISSGPRKSRTRFNKDGHLVYVDRYSLDDVPIAVAGAGIGTPKEATSTKRALNKSLPATATATEAIEDLPKSPKRPRVQSPRKTPINGEIELMTHLYFMIDRSSVPVGNSTPTATVLPVPSTPMLSGCDDSIDDSSGKLSRKGKRKDKHKSKHNLSSDTEKTSGKEHKRKRKKRSHLDESSSHMDVSANTSGSTIKIIFKALRLPGEDAPESQYFYVPANAVRSVDEASRPTSVETVEDSVQGAEQALVPVVLPPTTPAKVREAKEPKENPSPQRKVSPRKSSPQKSRVGRPRTSTTKAAVEISCCVCSQTGKSNQVVTCDECQRHYHFACLDPPLKKSPKIRGYSWHCADCDPTDEDALPKK